MSDFLNDYNRQKTLGDAAGPPSSLGAWTAKMETDAQQRLPQSASTGSGGGIDLSMRKAAVLCVVGLVLMACGAYALTYMRGGATVLGGVGFVIGAALTLFCGLGMLFARTSALGWRRVLLALAAGGAAGGLLPSWIWMMGLPLPGWLVGLAVGGLVFFVSRKRRR